MTVFDYNRRVWPEVIDYAEHVSGKILDLGCGNGNLTLYIKNKGLNIVGVDKSQELLDIAKKKCKAQFVKADMTELPFKDNEFDCILAIAIFHHLETEEARIKALDEMKRVLKPDGRIFLSVWAKYEGQGGKIIKWDNEERYYYFFKEKELKDLIKKAGFNVIWSKKSGENIFVEFSK